MLKDAKIDTTILCEELDPDALGEVSSATLLHYLCDIGEKMAKEDTEKVLAPFSADGKVNLDDLQKTIFTEKLFSKILPDVQ